MPDLSPLAIAGLIVVAVLAALGTAGALSGSWETVLLWQHQVPFAAAGATAVVDPVFGRDVSYYLFELPVPAPRPGHRRRAADRGAGRGRRALPPRRSARRRVPDAGPRPPRRAGRPLPADGRGRLPARQAGAGLQHARRRDRRQLHRPGRALLRLRRPHDRGRRRRGAPRRRRVHPLDLAAGRRDRGLVRPLDPARPGLPGGHPALHGGAERVRPGAAVHRQQHHDDAARLRPHQLGGPELPGRRAAHRADLVDEKATFKNARLWDYRPLQTTLDQIQTVRQYYDFDDVDVDRYVVSRDPPGDALGPRAGPGAQPAGRLVGQPADRLHPRLRAHDGPGQRGGRAGPAPALHPRHAAAVRARGAAGDPAADLLRRAPQRLDRGRRPAGRVRLPARAAATGPTATRPRRRPAGRATPASSSTASSPGSCSRPGSATSTCSSPTR